ncbi:hypothetical protein ScPMuIL_007540 [Solemya velum]
MENHEEILDALNDFEKKRGEEIPPLLDQFLNQVARTGETLFPWSQLKPLLVTKLEQVMHQFNQEFPLDHLPLFPNVENVKFEEMRMRIITALERFHGAPFTIQRLCELVTDPTRHYKRCDKFLRGIEKNVMVVSTVDPFGRKVVCENKNMVNGLDMNGHSLSKVEQTFSSLPNPPVPSWMTEYIKQPEQHELAADSTNMIKPECELAGDMTTHDQEKTNGENRTDIDRLGQAPVVCEVYEQQEKPTQSQLTSDEIEKLHQESLTTQSVETIKTEVSDSINSEIPLSLRTDDSSMETVTIPPVPTGVSAIDASPDQPVVPQCEADQSGETSRDTSSSDDKMIEPSSTPSENQISEDQSTVENIVETTEAKTEHESDQCVETVVSVESISDTSETCKQLEKNESDSPQTSQDQETAKSEHIFSAEQVSDNSQSQEVKSDQVVSSSDESVENCSTEKENVPNSEKNENNQASDQEKNNDNVEYDASKTVCVKMDCDVQKEEKVTTEDNSEEISIGEVSASSVADNEQIQQPMDED